MAAVITIEEFRARLKASGVTLRQWAKENGFDYYAVCAVVSRRTTNGFGQAHRVAVAMGIKAELDAPDTPAV